MYPKLKLVTYLDGVAQENFLNINNLQYEIKIFYCVDAVTEVEITPIHPDDAFLKIRNYGELATYSVSGVSRYLDLLGTGNFRLEIQLNKNDVNLELVEEFVIYVPSIYPKLQVEYFLSDEQQTNFLDIDNNAYDVKIALYFSETEYTYLDANDALLKVYLMDKNATLKIESDVFKLYTNEKGTCQIGAYYTYAGQELATKQEFLIYEGFLRDNFAKAGLSTFDYGIYLANTRWRVLLKSLFELFDILYAYQYDLNSINDHMFVKDKFLSVIASSFGFEKRAAYDGTKWEYAYNKMYRDLLYNLIDLIRSRGTKISYELFFGALGYDISLLEYWFDADGHLIEIDPEDFESSTFFAYTTDGNPLDNIPVPHIDPRKDVSPSNKYNYCSKSCYVRPVISLKTGLTLHPAHESTVYEKILIAQYLEWLKPNHIEYLQTIFKIDVSGTGDLLITYIGSPPVLHDILEDSNDDLHVAFLTELCGYYRSMLGALTQLYPLNYIPSKYVLPLGGTWVPPVGTLSNLEFNYFGSWRSGTPGYHEFGLVGVTGVASTIDIAEGTGIYTPFLQAIEDLVLYSNVTVDPAVPGGPGTSGIQTISCTETFVGANIPALTETHYCINITVDGTNYIIDFPITPGVDDWDAIALSIQTCLRYQTYSLETVVINAGKIEVTSATTGNDVVGLPALDDYYINVNVNNAGATEYFIEGDATSTYADIVAALNNETLDVIFSIVGGDIRCTSQHIGDHSSVVLSAGVSGTDLLASLGAGLDSLTQGTNDGSYYGDNRGLLIEHLPACTDELVTGSVVELEEFLETPLFYDSIYEYDEATPESVGIHYDRGVLLNEDNLDIINIQSFMSLYTSYSSTHTHEDTMEFLATYYSISVVQCEAILASS